MSFVIEKPINKKALALTGLIGLAGILWLTAVIVFCATPGWGPVVVVSLVIVCIPFAALLLAGLGLGLYNLYHILDNK